jgi:hypothetical protein
VRLSARSVRAGLNACVICSTRIVLTHWGEHFCANPAVFGKFRSDPESAKPMSLPKSASEAFLQ